MPRALRANIEGIPHHLVHRGNNRQAIFFGPADYTRYRSYLDFAGHRYGCDIHAYVLMTNHVHLLATQRAPNGITRMMQVVAGRYAVYVNRLRSRTGTLWEGRYHASAVETDRHFLRCHRYVELNPVRAGIVADAAEYRWSSYAHNALGRDDECITAHDCYLALGRDAASRRRAYLELFREQLTDESLLEIRLALQQNRPLGARGSERGGSFSDPSLTLL